MTLDVMLTLVNWRQKTKYEKIKEFKSFGATLENECLPTVKLKPGTWYGFRKFTTSNLLSFDNKNPERPFLINENVKIQ